MKKIQIVCLAVAVVAGVAVLALTTTGKPDTSIGVTAFVTAPEPVRGEVTVRGVVWAIAKDDNKVFAMIDTAEAKCNKPGCEKITLPVKSAKEAPKVGTEVTVTGQVSADGTHFAAQRVKKIGLL